jgi:hypothetical protein
LHAVIVLCGINGRQMVFLSFGFDIGFSGRHVCGVNKKNAVLQNKILTKCCRAAKNSCAEV